MPIRVQCSCGKSLAVKDELAGRTVKCPACQSALRIPAQDAPAAGSPAKQSAAIPTAVKPGASKAASPKSASSKSASSKPPAAGQSALGPSAPGPATAPRQAGGRAAASAASAASGGGYDTLFDEEGFESVAGPACPACGKPLRPGAVLCTHCGTNLQTGQRVVGHGAAPAAATLGHYQLDAAVEKMRTDAELQRRTTNVGMPWWFLLIMLIFLGCFTFGAVTIVNAAVSDSEATGLAAEIRKAAANSTIVWGCIISGLVLQGIARIWLTVVGFIESVGAGLTTLFLWHKFLGQLSDHPVVGLMYTLGFFMTLSGLGLAAADRWGA